MPQFNIQLINQPAKLPDDPNKEKVVVQPISDGSTTSNIYESRAKYKVDVNKNNLPIENFGSFKHFTPPFKMDCKSQAMIYPTTSSWLNMLP